MGGSAVVIPFSRKLIEDPLLQLEFGDRISIATLAAAASNAPRVMRSMILPGFEMRRELLRRPGWPRILHQIGGGHHFLLQLSHQLDRPCIHESNVRDIVLRRILHRDFRASGEQLGEAALCSSSQPEYDIFACRSAVERALLDPVHQFAGFAARGDEIKPAPRRHAVFAEPRTCAAIGSR